MRFVKNRQVGSPFQIGRDLVLEVFALGGKSRGLDQCCVVDLHSGSGRGIRVSGSGIRCDSPGVRVSGFFF